MKARDVMVTDVITVKPQDSVREVATLLLERRISAAPVVADGKLVGIVSEGDLMRRAEIGTQRRRSWWLELLSGPEVRAQDFVKAHAQKVADVMTRDVVTATEDTPLSDLAAVLEKRGIKRVPIVRAGRVVGIVSRRNILQAFARAAAGPVAAPSDKAIEEAIRDQIRASSFGRPWLHSVSVTNGVAELWGPVESDQERAALRVLAESTPGVREVRDNLYRIPAIAAA
ncbi:MAG TPA: CBS domain-containing protein [Beijerinckiaceae bacterium]|nr:CBS domain-containing protein [Beijerinckiaceae bacterium]